MSQAGDSRRRRRTGHCHNLSLLEDFRSFLAGREQCFSAGGMPNQRARGNDAADRCVQLGTDKRAIGFCYDKSSGVDIQLRLMANGIRNLGVSGGRPLVKRDASWNGSWPDWSF